MYVYDLEIVTDIYRETFCQKHISLHIMSLQNSRNFILEMLSDGGARTRTLGQALLFPCLKRKMSNPLERVAIDWVFSLNCLETKFTSRVVTKDLLESTLVRFSREKFCSIFNQATKKQQLLVYEASVKLLRFI